MIDFLNLFMIQFKYRTVPSATALHCIACIALHCTTAPIRFVVID